MKTEFDLTVFLDHWKGFIQSDMQELFVDEAMYLIKQAIAEHEAKTSSNLVNKLDKLHEQYKVDVRGVIDWDITNVPGGYIYSYVRLEANQMMCCFVPKSELPAPYVKGGAK